MIECICDRCGKMFDESELKEVDGESFCPALL